MSEKRFQIIHLGNPYEFVVKDNTTNKTYGPFEGDEKSMSELLNEQQELIEELHTSDHMGWERAEKFEKELKQKKIYIKRLEYKVQKFKEMNSEQQATIQSLKEDKAIAEDYANIFEKENVKLRKKLNNYKATVLGFLFIMEENGRISGKDDKIVKDLFKLINDE